MSVNVNSKNQTVIDCLPLSDTETRDEEKDYVGDAEMARTENTAPKCRGGNGENGKVGK